VQKQTGEILGLSLRILDDEVRQGMGLPDDMTGLLVENVDEASEAFEKGVRAGDIIAEAGQLPVDSIDDLQSRIDQAKEADRGSILILIRRGTDPRFIALSLQD
jgi:serine protease Do